MQDLPALTPTPLKTPRPLHWAHPHHPLRSAQPVAQTVCSEFCFGPCDILPSKLGGQGLAPSLQTTVAGRRC